MYRLYFYFYYLHCKTFYKIITIITIFEGLHDVELLYRQYVAMFKKKHLHYTNDKYLVLGLLENDHCIALLLYRLVPNPYSSYVIL